MVLQKGVVYLKLVEQGLISQSVGWVRLIKKNSSTFDCDFPINVSSLTDNPRVA